MDVSQALEIIKKYKEWHADPTGNSMPDPTQLGQAIDVAAESVKGAHGEILERYNAWRRYDSDQGEIDDEPIMPHGSEIASALDEFLTNCGGG